VTNDADRGPGTLREALYLAAGAAAPATVSIEVPRIALQSSLPPLVNAHGLRLVGASPGAQIDAGALSTGPVLDIAGPNVSVEAISIQNCPAIAILVRAVHFHLAASLIQSCDVGVEVAENASDTLLERNRYAKDRLGVRFAAAGHNSVVTSNEFVDDKDAGLWAVRSSSESQDTAITIRDNKFTEDGNAIVAGNIPVLIERNDFINAHQAAVDLVGAGAVVRGNQINGGAVMGIVGESASGAVIENNEIQGVGAYGVMLRRSSNMLVRDNRLNNCGYGLAFVLGDLKNVSHAVGNVIIEPKFNGIDVVGDSPTLSHNQVLRAHAYALHIDDFQAPNGAKVASQPHLEDNNFGSSPVKTAAMRVPP
jgi:parallel beta-helix repeat protein